MNKKVVIGIGIVIALGLGFLTYKIIKNNQDPNKDKK